MRRFLSVFIAVCLVVSLFTGIFVSMSSARADTSGNYQYTLAGGNATITKYYSGRNGVVVIPSTLGGYPVTTIGDGAFGDDDFTGSMAMAMAGLTIATSVTIPNSVTSIGNSAFSGSGLTEILVNGNNLNYASVDGVLYNKDITVLIQYPRGNTQTSFTIPSGVTSIGAYAFQSCTGLTNITIPNSVTSIGNSAFSGLGLTKVTIPNSVTTIANSAFNDCTKLTGVTIPNSVTSIGDTAFSGCTKLTGVTIPNSVTSIGIYAFVFCSSLTSVTIPNSVTSIGDSAFCDCTGLTGVTIPNSVTSIGNEAFSGCTKLTGVTIGSGVTSIGNGAFGLCDRLTEILVNGNNLNYASVGGVLYDKDITVLIQYPIRNTRTSFTIPNGVTSIGTYAFQSCTGLTNITIPNSVTSIGEGAFSGCMVLTSVTIGSGVTSIGDSAFSLCTALTGVTIPNSVTSIGKGAFSDCTKLTAAYFLGNAPTGTSNMFQSCAPGFTVHYATGAPGWSNPWYGYRTTAGNSTTKKQTVLVLHVGKSTFTMNGTSKTLDSPPVIKNGRTLVPIRAIIEAIGGTVGWDATTKKATVTLGKKTIALWIGKSAATVNGVSTPIDSTNAKVVPEIINDRTMLPLRFVTENLGCSVIWAAATKTITITYTP
jgi:hypothetical protein